MDYFDTTNFEATVRDYEFTRRAMKQIQTVVESDDFPDMDSDTIFRYLYERMQIVSFKDYLKRYLYERAGIREPFQSVSDDVYREIIVYSFEENAAPHSLEPTSTKWTATIKGWLQHDSVRRSAIFLLGFGLRMSDHDVSEFLTKVIKDEDFNFSDPTETVYWYCYKNGLSFADADTLLYCEDGEESISEVLKSGEVFLIERIADAEEKGLQEQKTLQRYLQYLKRSGKHEDKLRIAYSNFCELLDKVKQEILRIFQDDPVMGDAGRSDRIENITSADVEKMVCCGIPVTKNGNLQKASSSLLSRQFQNFRLSRQRIDGILKKQLQVDRYDLITLEFFLFSQKEYEFPEDRYRDFLDETNRILKESGLMELHPVNPYEAFVLMCLLTELPLATYADVWEMSFA